MCVLQCFPLASYSLFMCTHTYMNGKYSLSLDRNRKKKNNEGMKTKNSTQELFNKKILMHRTPNALNIAKVP